MYVCLCEAATERSVRKAIARGATSVDDIRRACGAGSGCGGCIPTIESMLADAPASHTAARVLDRASAGSR